MASVGEMLVRGLKARGVEVVFGIPGVHTIQLYRGLTGSGVRHVTARHEGGAGFMADGYARASGKPGVAFVITGPGLTNALTPMGQAREDSIPILVISGVNRRDSLGQGFGLLHEMPDQGGMVRTLCPSFQVTSPDMLEPVLNRAFAALTVGRPGPVHIEVPTDVMPMECPEPVSPPLAPVGRTPDAALLQAAAHRLNGAQKVVILAGGGARGAGAALRALAEKLDAPVVSTTNARGLMHGHPLNLAASPSFPAVRALVKAADQVLAVGTEFGQTDYDMYADGATPDLPGMIRIDICGDQLARQAATVRVCSDASLALEALLPMVEARKADGAKRTAETLAAARVELGALSPKMASQLVMVEAMRDAMPGSMIVGDSTQPVYAGNLCHDHDLAGGWFNAATGFGSLGYGPGAAVGAAIGRPGVPVICLVGDGGLQFSPGELRTAVDENLDITFLVWNSASYQEIAEAMEASQIEVLGCDPSPLKMEPFAAACDLPFQSVPNDPEALKAALRAPRNGPRMIEVVTF